MILVTGRQPANAFGNRAGFTLIEILMVLGLIAAATTLIISNFASMAGRGDELNTEEILLQAVRKARFIAAKDRITTELRFDEESFSLKIGDGGSDFETLPLDEAFAEESGSAIRFYLIPASRGLDRLPDPGDTDLETPVVKFAADRSSSPFIAEIDYGSGAPERLQFDPFSSLVITQK